MQMRLPALKRGGWYRHLTRGMSPEDRLLIAVSGGGDSVALLYLALPPEKELNRLLVVTIHHGDEPHGTESTSFVRRLCKRLGVPYRMVKICIDPEREKQVGYEAAAREFRYEALENAARKYSCTRLLTAHTRDDQAESVLLSLMRGADTGGLSGIRPVRGNWRRPLLGVGRDQLRAFMKKEAIEYLEDPYNDNDRFARVQVRQKIKPVILESFGEGAWNNLAESAVRLQEADEALDSAARTALIAVTAGSTPGWLAIESEKLRSYVAQVRSRALLLAWAHAVGTDVDSAYLSRAQRTRLEGLLQKPKPGMTLKLGGVIIRVSAGRMIFDGISGSDPITLKLPGSVKLPDGSKLTVSAVRGGPELANKAVPGRIEYLDADRILASIIVRAWRSGDRWCPLGRDGREVKVVRSLRRPPGQRIGILWVIESLAQEIIWVPGERIADNVKLTAETRKVLKVKWDQPTVAHFG